MAARVAVVTGRKSLFRDPGSGLRRTERENDKEKSLKIVDGMSKTKERSGTKIGTAGKRLSLKPRPKTLESHP